MDPESNALTDEDPVQFLYDNKQYQDWTVIVEDPNTGDKKEFGVISHNLIAHSKVFRKMMSDPKWVQEKILLIPNMSPNTFNLIYRFVNGGDLPAMSRQDAAYMTVAAVEYDIQRLVKKGCKRLVPTKVAQLFPALTFVSFIADTSLEPHVVKFVRLNTEEIMLSVQFLQLNKRCIEFIVKQEFLSLPEVEIWRNLVKWAKNQVGEDKDKTLRSVLGGALKYVRFRTLNHEEIVKEVAPTNVLSSDELSSLLCSVIGKQPWSQPGFCSSQTARQPVINTVPQAVKPAVAPFVKMENPLHVFTTKGSCTPSEKYVANTQNEQSYFTIETVENIELKSFVFKPKPVSELGGAQFYSTSCSITVKEQANDSYVTICSIVWGKKEQFVGDPTFSVPAFKSGVDQQYVKLEANNKYLFTVSLTPAHMTFNLSYSTGLYSTCYDCQSYSTTNGKRTVTNVMTVQHHSPIHVQEIHYNVLT